ncbi:hypothetical protein LEMLEM_LOCUS7594 [Lemmus lemmus]
MTICRGLCRRSSELQLKFRGQPSRRDSSDGPISFRQGYSTTDPGCSTRSTDAKFRKRHAS